MPRPLVPRWWDEAAYDPLLQAERSVFAWEWLRRNKAYCEAARAALVGDAPDRVTGKADAKAGRWGLHAFEAPGLAAPSARPMWRADCHTCVLKLVRCPSRRGEGPFDLGRIASLSTILRSRNGNEHWLISDGLRGIRFDVACGERVAGPATLCSELPLLLCDEGSLLILRQLVAFFRSGAFSTALHRPERRARRWIAMLRAHDALAAGASQREIAAVLLDEEARAPRWRVEAPSLRSQVQRLVRGARAMADGGYRLLLANETRDRRT